MAKKAKSYENSIQIFYERNIICIMKKNQRILLNKKEETKRKGLHD